MEMKTLNQWMAEWGYKWVEGRECFMKSALNHAEAQEILYGYEQDGAVRQW